MGLLRKIKEKKKRMGLRVRVFEVLNEARNVYVINIG